MPVWDSMDFPGSYYVVDGGDAVVCVRPNHAVDDPYEPAVVVLRRGAAPLTVAADRLGSVRAL